MWIENSSITLIQGKRCDKNILVFFMVHIVDNRPSTGLSWYPFSCVHSGTSSSCMVWSSRPWTISNPDDVSQYTAHSLRSLRAPTPRDESFSITSDISNRRTGSGMLLLDASVLRIPGSSVVRATYITKTCSCQCSYGLAENVPARISNCINLFQGSQEQELKFQDQIFLVNFRTFLSVS